jgi:hypothetical protein
MTQMSLKLLDMLAKKAGLRRTTILENIIRDEARREGISAQACAADPPQTKSKAGIVGDEGVRSLEFRRDSLPG